MALPRGGIGSSGSSSASARVVALSSVPPRHAWPLRTHVLRQSAEHRYPCEGEEEGGVSSQRWRLGAVQ
jgi:hypothetical protein